MGIAYFGQWPGDQLVELTNPDRSIFRLKSMHGFSLHERVLLLFLFSRLSFIPTCWPERLRAKAFPYPIRSFDVIHG